MVLESKLHPYLSSQWSGDVTFQRTCDAVVVTPQDLEADCTFEQEGTDYYYSSPDYPNTVPSGSFNCSVSFSPDSPASYEISYAHVTRTRFRVLYWTPSTNTRLDQSGTPSTSASSGCKFTVTSWVGNNNRLQDVAFRVKIVPVPTDPVIELAEGETYSLVHSEPSPGPSKEYRLKGPEGNRLRISFSEFNIGSSTGSACKIKDTNYLSIGRSDDLFYTRRSIYRLANKDLTGESVTSVSNILNLYINSPFDMADSSAGTVSVV